MRAPKQNAIPGILASVLCLAVVAEVEVRAAGAVNGRVVSAGGRPVEHARVEVVGVAGSVVFSDREGAFALADVEPPLTLVITHPRFQTHSETVEEMGGSREIALLPKQEVYETIAVSAHRGEENFAPVSVATTVAEPDRATVPPATVAQLLSGTPGVAENGQGGIFQTYSVRGVSRQRVLTLIAGMRIVGERRAGVSASFLDPGLLKSVEVVRGPSSTYYGSGALGGVVQLFPRLFEALSVTAGVKSQGAEKWLLVGGGDPGRSWGLALRDAGNARDGVGETLNSGFTQLSGSFRRSWERRGLDFDVTLLGSVGRDIGKANTDWPDRVTTYPEERHAIARFGVRRPARWDFEIMLHPNSVRTEVVEADVESSTVDNRALDIGLSWQRRIEAERLGGLRFGFDYFGRRGVTALERSYGLGTTAPIRRLEQETLSDGEEDELGLFGAWERNRGKAVLVVGGRLAWQRQETAISERSEDDAATAFAGLVVPVGRGFELVLNAGSGLRFPSLSERFFTGTTGRGLVVGNPALRPEGSLNLDAGLRFFGERLYVAGYLFRNDIEDYIERLEIAPGRLTFDNLSRGRIEGVEVDGFIQIDSSWTLEFGGHRLEGRDQDGLPLADVPADRAYLGARFVGRRWGGRVRWEERASRSEAGSGEKPIPGAHLVALAADYEVRPGLTLRLAVDNALDEAYFNSADSKVPLAPGRSASVSVRWSPRGD